MQNSRTQKLREGLFLRTSNVQQMQSVVLVDEQAMYLVDPGYFPDEIDDIQNLAAHFAPQRDPYLILTHSDFDHIAGVPYFPDYTVIAADTWDGENERRSREQIEQFDGEFYVSRPWSGTMPSVEIRHRMADGQSLGNMTFYHAKGHTDDGLITVYNDIAIVGDYLASIEFPFIYTSFRDYVATMSHFRHIVDQHDIQLVVTQHGPHAEGHTEVERRIDISEDYLQQVQHAVDQGLQAGHTLDEVVERAREHVTFAGKELPRWIRKFHDNNVKRAWEERSASSR